MEVTNVLAYVSATVKTRTTNALAFATFSLLVSVTAAVLEPLSLG